MSIEINSIKQNQINTANNKMVVAFKSNPLPNDKVELSTKRELSNGTKIGIGMGIAAVIGLGFELTLGKCKHLKSLWEGVNKKFGKGVSGNNSVDEGKKYLDKIDDIKENFSKIFDRDYTKDEAQELALKYKEIFETEDNNKFMGKFFERLKEDYNLANIELPWTITKLDNSLEYANFSIYGGFKYNKDLLNIQSKKVINNGIEEKVPIITNLKRDDFINYTAHELKHAQQYKLGCSIDPHKVIQAHVDRCQKQNDANWQNAMQKCGNNIIRAREYLRDFCERDILKSYANIERISQDSPLYQKGLDLIESFRNAKDSRIDYVGYKNTLHEKEAFDAGGRMEQIYKWLTN